MQTTDLQVLHRMFDGFLESVGLKKKRSMSMSRLYEQLWSQLYQMEDWAYPLDVYVADNGVDLFSIVAQGGKLFQVPLEVNQETLTMGDWIQVKEEFTPVTQQKSRFFIRRQKDGRYRWTAIAGTTVLNRVAQIDSHKLFDCFVEQANKRGKFARLDFYHWGETDPQVWEFGTADFVARDGVCYIASGLFDEGHPLAEATIRACEEGKDEWGCSIEFYSYAEPEKIIVDPEVVIPVYNEGENTRISVVLEEDAAGLFTRMNVLEGIQRTMDATTKEKLAKLYGDDTEGLQKFLDQFEQTVDNTNQRVKNDKLIHRTVEGSEAAGEDDPAGAQEESDEVEEEVDDSDLPELVLDDLAVAAISQQMMATDEFRALTDDVRELKQLVAQSIVEREQLSKEVSTLRKDNNTLVRAVEQLSKEDGVRKSEYLQDLPSRKRQVVTHKPSEARNFDEDGEEYEVIETYDDVANRTLSKLKHAY